MNIEKQKIKKLNHRLDWPEDDWDNAADENKLPNGTIVRDWREDGIRHLIMRGPASFNAYLGIPKDHPLAGFGYDDLPIDCHGGLTFSGGGNGKVFPQGYWWYGFDFAHLGDRCFYYEDGALTNKLGVKKWTIAKIVEELYPVSRDFRSLAVLAEKIDKKKGEKLKK